MKPTLHTEFLKQSIYRLKENTPRINNCLNRLSEIQVWQRPNESSNSIGNLILHLCGNITQYIISSLGNEPDVRLRDQEFLARSGHSKKELFQKLSETVKRAISIIKNLSEDDLLKTRSVQGFKFSGLAIIIHVVEHYSYHTGQIAFWTKLLKDEDLGFYKDLDLNVKNEF